MRGLLRPWALGAVLVAVLSGGPAAASLAASPGQAGKAVSAAASPAVEVCGLGPPVVRPTSMVLTCADNGELAEHLKWSKWTATTATAAGLVTWRVCATDCAGSQHFDSATANVTLSDPVPESGKLVLFTRLGLQVTGPTPKGFLRDLTFNEAPTTAPPPQAGPARPPARPLRPGAPTGTLDYAQIEGFWDVAGGPADSVAVPGAGDYTQDQIAAAITGAESSFLPGIIQPGVDYCGPGSDRAGWGLWQITCGNSVPQYGTDFQLLDPWNNAEAAVYKYDADAEVGLNGFDPWSTYTDGAYVRFLQHASADTNLSDPGEYVQVNSTPPGTPSSPGPAPGSTVGPPMPGHVTAAAPAAVSGPVVRDPASGNLEVYATGTNGHLMQRAWKPHKGWLGWVDLGGSITGTPSAIYDPVTRHLEVYVRGARGALFQKYWAPRHGWSGWIRLGGSITGSPDAVYDPLTGNLEVYATGTNGHLMQLAWNRVVGWLAWLDLGGSITGSPSAIYDPATGHLEVYAHGARGPLFQKFFSLPRQVWSGWIGLGGSITGSPDAMYDPASGNLEVYATGNKGNLVQKPWNPSRGWLGWVNLGGSITGTPSALFDPATGHVEVYVRGARGSLFQKYWPPGGGWSGWIKLGGAVTGSPDALYDAASGNLEVYATGTHGELQQKPWNPSRGWLSWVNLGGRLASL